MKLGCRAALCVFLEVALGACQARPASRANPQKLGTTAAISSAPPVHNGAPATSASLAGGAASTPVECAPHAAAARAPTLTVAPDATAPLAAHLGLWLADEQHAILSASPESAWAEGEPSYAGEYTAQSAVAFARLPKSLRAWLGHPVRVLGARGVVCETRLQRFAVRGRVTPDPATAEAWDGCADPPLAPGAIAQRIWSLTARAGRQLVAEFAAPCKGALLALDPDLPPPAVALPEPASAELGERALAEFRKLPAYTEVQARFQRARPEAEGAWDDREVRRSIWSLSLPAHVPLVFVSTEVGPGCTAPSAAFSASLSALWSDNGASLALLAVPTSLDDRRLTPRAVLDLENDGSPEVLLGPDGRFAAQALLATGKASPSFSKVLLCNVPFFGGPC